MGVVLLHSLHLCPRGVSHDSSWVSPRPLCVPLCSSHVAVFRRLFLNVSLSLSCFLCVGFSPVRLTLVSQWSQNGLQTEIVGFP